MTTLSSLSVHLGILAALLVLQKDHLDSSRRTISTRSRGVR